MSIQEQKLTAIADAIREKDGTTEPIPAGDFAARILAIQGGGGDVSLAGLAILEPPYRVTYRPGELFDPTGMSVYAAFSNGYGLYVNHADLVFVPAGPLAEGVTSVGVQFSWNGETQEAAQAVSVQNAQIYGVEWDGTATTKLTRTDAAAGFVDPVPYVEGATEYGSPFDDIMPWAGMVRVADAQAGELVAIPKFWYKLTKNGDALKIQIAAEPVGGFSVSPAHMDRGDGKGERDVAYVGRYKSGPRYKSEANVSPIANISRSQGRIGTKSLGEGVWMADYIMWFTICLLYLVEFADWDSQACIGLGNGDGKSKRNTGYTDSMPYHTGTTLAKRTDNGSGNQYRWIEGLWDNLFEWLDGCFAKAEGFYIILNPNKFNDQLEDGVLVGKTSSGYPTALEISTRAGAPIFYPYKAGGSGDSYIPDIQSYPTNSLYKWEFYSGSSYLSTTSREPGMFSIRHPGYSSVGQGNATTGCRVMKL